jgi:DNA-3-methyladenine glycosylase I
LRKYHDEEWGRPLHDDRALFEMLILEGMSCGLSWEIILKKREHMRNVFDRFDPQVLVKYDVAKIDELMQDPGIIRHRAKIEAVISNANAYFKIKELHGSLDRFLWSYTQPPKDSQFVKPVLGCSCTSEYTPLLCSVSPAGNSFGAWGYVNNAPIVLEPFEIKTKNETSDQLSKGLKKLGFKFVGSTIIYSFMQAVGMVNDHEEGCVFRHMNYEPSVDSKFVR